MSDPYRLRDSNYLTSNELDFTAKLVKFLNENPSDLAVEVILIDANGETPGIINVTPEVNPRHYALYPAGAN